MCIKKENIFSLACGCALNNIHKVLCLSGRSTDLKIKVFHTREHKNLAKTSVHSLLEIIKWFFSIRLYFSSICLKTFI